MSWNTFLSSHKISPSLEANPPLVYPLCMSYPSISNPCYLQECHSITVALLKVFLLYFNKNGPNIQE